MVADDVDVVAGAAAVGLVCDHHLRSDHGDRRASRAGALMQGDTARIEGAAMAGKDVSIAYADGTGSFLVLLAMVEQQGLFGKYGVDVRSVAVKEEPAQATDGSTGPPPYDRENDRLLVRWSATNFGSVPLWIVDRRVTLALDART